MAYQGQLESSPRNPTFKRHASRNLEDALRHMEDISEATAGISLRSQSDGAPPRISPPKRFDNRPSPAHAQHQYANADWPMGPMPPAPHPQNERKISLEDQIPGVPMGGWNPSPSNTNGGMGMGQSPSHAWDPNPQRMQAGSPFGGGVPPQQQQQWQVGAAPGEFGSFGGSRSTERRPSVGGKWSKEEDLCLKNIVDEHGPKNWKKVAELLGPTRSDVQCLHRWNKVLKPGLLKGPWSEEEDEVVRHMVQVHGVGNVKWSAIASRLHGRIGKQCRERWFNHLDPEIKRSDWTAEEERVLFEAQRSCGNRWSEIAKLLPGRTENAVKNRFNSSARKKWLRENGLADTDKDDDFAQIRTEMVSLLDDALRATDRNGGSTAVRGPLTKLMGLVSGQRRAAYGDGNRGNEGGGGGGGDGTSPTMRDLPDKLKPPSLNLGGGGGGGGDFPSGGTTAATRVPSTPMGAFLTGYADEARRFAAAEATVRSPRHLPAMPPRNSADEEAAVAWAASQVRAARMEPLDPLVVLPYFAHLTPKGQHTVLTHLVALGHLQNGGGRESQPPHSQENRHHPHHHHQQSPSHQPGALSPSHHSPHYGGSSGGGSGGGGGGPQPPHGPPPGRHPSPYYSGGGGGGGLPPQRSSPYAHGGGHSQASPNAGWGGHGGGVTPMQAAAASVAPVHSPAHGPEGMFTAERDLPLSEQEMKRLWALSPSVAASRYYGKAPTPHATHAQHHHHHHQQHQQQPPLPPGPPPSNRGGGGGGANLPPGMSSAARAAAASAASATSGPAVGKDGFRMPMHPDMARKHSFNNGFARKASSGNLQPNPQGFSRKGSLSGAEAFHKAMTPKSSFSHGNGGGGSGGGKPAPQVSSSPFHFGATRSFDQPGSGGGGGGDSESLGRTSASSKGSLMVPTVGGSSAAAAAAARAKLNNTEESESESVVTVTSDDLNSFAVLNGIKDDDLWFNNA